MLIIKNQEDLERVKSSFNKAVLKSLDERSVLEAFVVERILVVKKNGN